MSSVVGVEVEEEVEVGVVEVEAVEDKSRLSGCGFSSWEKSTADAGGGM
jgi:hypothetical protein